jgi:hypothetical protein
MPSNVKPSLQRVEQRVFWVRAMCPENGCDGQMVADVDLAWNYFDVGERKNVLHLHHRCDKCGHYDCLAGKYPRREYEAVDSDRTGAAP